MTADAVPLDRRARRRQETIEEVLDIAVEIMAEQGVAGLSIGEVARRMGIRPPSLYVYFPSKHALYDALFARGALGRSSSDLRAATADLETVERRYPRARSCSTRPRTFVRWSVEHPAYAQLLFWRPVPGFEPSPRGLSRRRSSSSSRAGRFRDLQQRGLSAPTRRSTTCCATGPSSPPASSASSSSNAPARVLRRRPVHRGAARRSSPCSRPLRRHIQLQRATAQAHEGDPQ